MLGLFEDTEVDAERERIAKQRAAMQHDIREFPKMKERKAALLKQRSEINEKIGRGELTARALDETDRQLERVMDTMGKSQNSHRSFLVNTCPDEELKAEYKRLHRLASERRREWSTANQPADSKRRERDDAEKRLESGRANWPPHEVRYSEGKIAEMDAELEWMEESAERKKSELDNVLTDFEGVKEKMIWA